MSEADIRGAMLAGMNAENRRRELASQTPGAGTLMQLPQSPSAAAVGKSSLDMPAVGEGYDTVAEISAAVHKAYGEARPVYAAPEVGGSSYSRRSVIAEMADRVFGRQDAAAAADAVEVISPQAASRPSLLARLLRRGRR